MSDNDKLFIALTYVLTYVFWIPLILLIDYLLRYNNLILLIVLLVVNVAQVLVMFEVKKHFN